MGLKIYDYDRSNPLHKERFGSLNREWLERYFCVEDRDAAAFADPEEYILDDGGCILMVETEEGIIGTGSLVFLEDGVYEIAKMAVTDKCQARGIGDALMQALFARARELGATKLFIVSNTKLERAIRLYRKYGFYEIDVEPHRDSYERCDIALECLLTQDNTIKEALV